jgi:hypothetical protein
MIVQGIKTRIVTATYVAGCCGYENIVYATVIIANNPIMKIDPQKLIDGFITVKLSFEFIVPPLINDYLS